MAGLAIPKTDHTVDLEGFSRFRLDPFAIDIGDVLFEEGRIIELASELACI